MSDLTSCNYCDYTAIMSRRGKAQAILEPGHDELGGVTLYIRPLDETLDREKHFSAWFMELTDSCCC